MCDLPHSYLWHDTFIHVTWLNPVCDTNPSYASSLLFIFFPPSSWLLFFLRRDSFICVIGPIHICYMTHSCVWHDVFRCVTWLILVPRVYFPFFRPSPWLLFFLRRDSFINIICLIFVTWHIHTCDVTYSDMWHNSFLCLESTFHFSHRVLAFFFSWRRDSFICVTWLISMCRVTHSYASSLLSNFSTESSIFSTEWSLLFEGFANIDSTFDPAYSSLSPPATHTLTLSHTHTCLFCKRVSRK